MSGGIAAMTISMARKRTNDPTKLTAKDMIGTNPVGRDYEEESENKEEE